MAQLLLPEEAVTKLLGAKSCEAALLYLYLQSGRPLSEATVSLSMPQHKLELALALLRQMGLYDEQEKKHLDPEKPRYTEEDLARELRQGSSFGALVGEVQRRFGRILSTEELKILLSFCDYLAMPTEVVGMLITYCIDRAKSRGAGRMPSMRAIEKEAYRWADQDIDTIEEAAAYVGQQLRCQTMVERIAKLLQISGRELTPGEEKYVLSWLDLGFTEAEIQMAYEKTCLNTGGLKWQYLNSILKSWHEQGLHRASDIAAGDRGAEKRPAPKPIQKVQRHDDELTQFEKDAIAKLMRRHRDEEG